MKVTTGGKGTYSRRGLLRTGALVALALGIALTLLLAARPSAADGPFGFLVPLVLEEFRTPPDIIADDLPSVRDVRGTQTQTQTLVKNTGQGTASIGASPSKDIGQAFTTGSNSSGYTLNSVKMYITKGGGNLTFAVGIHAD